MAYKEQLLQDNAEWARLIGLNVVRKLRGAPGLSLWEDDIVGGALEGLWAAAQHWNGTGNFQGYAYARVRGAAFDVYRQLTHSRAKPENRLQVSYLNDVVLGGLQRFQSTHPEWTGGGSGVEERFAYEPDTIDLDTDRIIQQVIKKLPDQRKECLLLALDGFEYWEIAERWHRGENRVSQVMRAAINEAREMLGKPRVPKRAGNYNKARGPYLPRKAIASIRPARSRGPTRRHSGF